MKMLSENWLLDNGEILVGVHPIGTCAGRVCVIHAKTEHHMSNWEQIYRRDRNIFERICAHGTGHPDPDQFEYWKNNNMEHEVVHGCDGCCAPPREESQ